MVNDALVQVFSVAKCPSSTTKAFVCNKFRVSIHLLFYGLELSRTAIHTTLLFLLGKAHGDIYILA